MQKLLKSQIFVHLKKNKIISFYINLFAVFFTCNEVQKIKKFKK
eukprot:UN16963